MKSTFVDTAAEPGGDRLPVLLPGAVRQITSRMCLGPDDLAMLSRIDGATPVAELGRVHPLGASWVEALLRRLERDDLLYFASETSTSGSRPIAHTTLARVPLVRTAAPLRASPGAYRASPGARGSGGVGGVLELDGRRDKVTLAGAPLPHLLRLCRRSQPPPS